MKFTCTAFLLLCIFMSVSGGVEGANETSVFGVLNDRTLLPCDFVGNATPSFTQWIKNGKEILSRNHSASSPGQRIRILSNGSLDIHIVLQEDEGSYACSSTFQNYTTQTNVQFHVVYGPNNVSASIGPATTLPNGTLVVLRDSTVSFSCSSSSYPSQNLFWGFYGVSSSNASLVSGSGTLLYFQIEKVQRRDQGEYICMALNTLSHKAANWTKELLVYYAPERHPECLWGPGNHPAEVQFSCSWFGAYPTPTLRWGENHNDPAGQKEGHLYSFAQTDRLVMTLNRSELFDGQNLKCKAQHPAIHPGEEKSCFFTLKPPFPEGEPLVTALVDTNITLTCTEKSSLPPANTSWRRGTQQEVIAPGSKYIVSLEGPTLKLTIVNVSKDDEGLYFCRSENPLSICELEVLLTVKTSSVYTGAIIGVFLAVLIVGIGGMIAKTLYTRRDRICLGGGFGTMEDEKGDIFSLVDSDDEMFPDAVPRLPPLTNGHTTTMVQIHRIPSSDHEDTEVTDTCPQQQEDTAQTQEPVDLVVF